MLGTFFKTLILAFLGLVILSQEAFACPKIGMYPDVNCDGELSILVIGDSLTVGARDRDRYLTDSSWPNLLEELIEDDIPGLIKVHKIAQAGLTCHQLVRKVIIELSDDTSNQSNVQYDLVIPFCGMNDLLKDRSIEQLLSSMQMMSKFLQSRGFLVYWAKLTPTYRMKIRKGALTINNSIIYPALPFDRISKRSLGRDMLHLNKYGYKRLASIAYRYITQVYVRRAERQLGLLDLDGNGIYDRFESQFAKRQEANKQQEEQEAQDQQEQEPQDKEEQEDQDQQEQEAQENDEPEKDQQKQDEGEQLPVEPIVLPAEPIVSGDE